MVNGIAGTQESIIDVIRKLKSERKKLAGMQRQLNSGVTTVTGSPATIINQGQPKDNTNNITPNASQSILPSIDNTFDIGDGTRSHRYIFAHTFRMANGSLISGGVSITKNASNDMLLGVASGRSFNFGTSASIGATISGAGAIFSSTSITATTNLAAGFPTFFSSTSTITTIASTTTTIDGSICNINSPIINLGNTTADRIDFEGEVGTDIIPKNPATKSLGNASQPWLNIFCSSTITGNDIVLTGKLDMSSGGLNDDIIFSGSNMFKVGVTSGSASAGAATLPSNPVGFFNIRDTGGTIRKVPYYA